MNFLLAQKKMILVINIQNVKEVSMKNTVPVCFRIETKERVKLEKEAKKDGGRTLSNYLRMIVTKRKVKRGKIN